MTNKARTDLVAKCKHEFSALKKKDSKAKQKWDNFVEGRECATLRPCIRTILNFCVEQGGEFAKLRYKFKHLGTRDHAQCRCKLAVPSRLVSSLDSLFGQ